MIKPLLYYARNGIRPRLRRIVLQPQVALSLCMGAICFYWGPGSNAGGLKPNDVAGVILTYAAIAFGFCITGMALVITLPSDNFLRKLQRHHTHANGQSSYLDLLFVFSWTAVCDWILVVLGIVTILVRGTAATLLDKADGGGWRLFVSLFLAICVYSICQFLMTVITLAQVGDLYAREIDKESHQSAALSD